MDSDVVIRNEIDSVIDDVQHGVIGVEIEHDKVSGNYYLILELHEYEQDNGWGKNKVKLLFTMSSVREVQPDGKISDISYETVHSFLMSKNPRGYGARFFQRALEGLENSSPLSDEYYSYSDSDSEYSN